MIAVLLVAYIADGNAESDILSTKKLAKNYKIFFDPPAVLISPQKHQLRNLIPVPIFIRRILRAGEGGLGYWRYTKKEPALGPEDTLDGKDSLGKIKRLDDRLRQKK